MKNAHSLLIGCCLVILAAAPLSHSNAGERSDLPVAPLAAEPFGDWTNAYVLANEHLTLAVVPAIGRIIHIGTHADSNLLHAPSPPPPPDDPPPSPRVEWINYGGDWLFPVSQKRWTLFQDKDWPPSPLLDGRPWEGRAWRTANDTQCALLQQHYPAPLNIKVSRLIKLPTNSTTFSIEQRIERTGESSIPVTLWNITQVEKPSHVLLPATSTARAQPRYLLMMGTPPAEQTIRTCDDILVFDATTPDEIKIGSYSTNSWIAAIKDRHLLIETVSPSGAPQSAYPDGGCSIELYANRSLGYAEIENLSPEKILEPGETLENVLWFTLHPINPAKPPCELAQEVRNLLAFPPSTQ